MCCQFVHHFVLQEKCMLKICTVENKKSVFHAKLPEAEDKNAANCSSLIHEKTTNELLVA